MSITPSAPPLEKRFFSRAWRCVRHSGRFRAYRMLRIPRCPASRAGFPIVPLRAQSSSRRSPATWTRAVRMSRPNTHSGQGIRECPARRIAPPGSSWASCCRPAIRCPSSPESRRTRWSQQFARRLRTIEPNFVVRAFDANESHPHGSGTARQMALMQHLGIVIGLLVAASGAASECTLCFYGPDNMAVDRQGNLFIVDTDHRSRSRVLKVSKSGAKLKEYSGFPSVPGSMSGPEGIALSPSGDILVTDAGAMDLVVLSPAL